MNLFQSNNPNRRCVLEKVLAGLEKGCRCGAFSSREMAAVSCCFSKHIALVHIIIRADDTVTMGLQKNAILQLFNGILDSAHLSI